MAPECRCHHVSPADPGRATAPIGPEETVGDVVRRHDAALEILRDMGINHCCGAHLTLGEAAAAAGVSLEGLLAALGASRKVPA